MIGPKNGLDQLPSTQGAEPAPAGGLYYPLLRGMHPANIQKNSVLFANFFSENDSFSPFFVLVKGAAPARPECKNGVRKDRKSIQCRYIELHQSGAEWGPKKAKC